MVPSIELIGGGKNIFITVLFKKHKDYTKAVLYIMYIKALAQILLGSF